MCALSLSGLLLVTGCSGGVEPGGGKATGEPKATKAPAKGDGASGASDSDAAADPSPAPTRLDFTPDPARAPKSRADAVRLAEKVAAGPELWGAGYVLASPDSDPGSWPVLDDACVWQREPVPDGVLASITRYSELPAADGKGPIRVSATVTVHKDVDGADWEQASTLEEALRCPEQVLHAGERVSGLTSIGMPLGRNGNEYAEDSIYETGLYQSDTKGGPYPYAWTQARIGQVTVAATGRASKGRTDAELSQAMAETQSTMLIRLEGELEAAG
ncbi:hypothetical protein ACFS5L_34335 [Streptomyces phyllanthi]|uniref:Uncharacterized protein n=1 Tax=Streptomyces phyllanthi TaxID=1803180 RepID=A0A5N8W0B7_9ACTN|nr:hypothetical protein [Streptomyces phyllanthi]MPY40950.1 hypothetical protein [Streptomyces phyllanthi]